MRPVHRSRSLYAFVAGLAVVAAACAPLTGVVTTKPTLTFGTYRLGPFNLAAMDMPGSESVASQANIPRPPGDIGIKTMTFDLVDAHGDPIPRMDAHLHHVLLMNASQTSPICPGEQLRFAGSGAERTPLNLGLSYAYRTAASDRWNALWHIMNMSEEPLTVYIQYKIGYVPASDPHASRPVTPFFIDVTGCGTNAEYNVPGDGGPSSVHTRTRTITAPWDGVAVVASGHLHAGGIDVSIKRDATGQVGCKAIARYDVPEPMDFPSSITWCGMHNSVVGGATYTLTSRYDNSSPHEGVMGIMLAYVWRGTPPSG
jgi:hypothetical protein